MEQAMEKHSNCKQWWRILGEIQEYYGIINRTHQRNILLWILEQFLTHIYEVSPCFPTIYYSVSSPMDLMLMQVTAACCQFLYGI